jgi:uncharacterized cupredoxin-like copper-binding protein
MHRISAGLLLGLMPGFIPPAQREPAVSEFSIQATDYAFAAPDSVAGGLVHVTLTNKGKEPHHAQIIRLNKVSMAQFDSVVAKANADAQTKGDAAYLELLSVATVAGGPSTVSPGRSGEVTVELPPGEYALICFIPSPDGHAHLSKGMSRAFKVGPRASAQQDPPKSAATITMTDFLYTPFPVLQPGKVTLQVLNNGPEPHEMEVFRLKGITAQQLVGMLSGPPAPSAGASPAGPPPFEAVGGMQALMSGAKAWAMINLEAGDYAALCLVPSPANDGKPHAALGMVTTFTVQ